MDYKQKYLKYKSKYLKLKGGNPPEETDFTNELKFKKIGEGKQGKIYNLYGTNYAYKVFAGLTEPRGVWTRGPPKISIVIGGSVQAFNISVDNYRRASELGLGPHFYKSYTFTKNNVKYGVIIMDCINGSTIRNLRAKKLITPDIERRFNELCNELHKNNLIIQFEDHEDNFMVDNETGKIYGIDF